MKNFILSLLLMYLGTRVTAQGLSKKEQDKVYDFIALIKHHEVEKLSYRVRFPLKREYPLPMVKTRAEFVKRHDEIFDKKLIEMISTSNPESDWSEVGWRGTMLFNGVLWLYDGRLLAVNYQSRVKKAMMDKSRIPMLKSLSIKETSW